MQSPKPKLVKIIAVLLAVSLISIFALKAKRYIFGPGAKELPPEATRTADDINSKVSISAEALSVLEWQKLE